MKENIDAYKLLVDLLHDAEQLEHCLLLSYLYTACSLKSTPQEFAFIEGNANRRSAIQFERVRGWKQSILTVAHEEMLHLHYVDCMLRALGESPSFNLPKRDVNNGKWIIPNWTSHLEETDTLRSLQVSLERLTLENIIHFLFYEASDSLQEENPFGVKVMSLFHDLYKFEIDLRIESMLFNIQNDDTHNDVKDKLKQIYNNLTSIDPLENTHKTNSSTAMDPIDLFNKENLQIQSIAELYYDGILPLYEQAFDSGWVKYSNLNLVNEQLNQDYAGEGLLPIGPIYRSKNFDNLYKRNIQDPLSNYKQVEDIVNEIVNEGEGTTNFEKRAKALLTKVQELGGPRAYLEASINDKENPSKTKQDWLDDIESLRKSHIYRFAMIMIEYTQELDLAQKCNITFKPWRDPISTNKHVDLEELTEELVSQFNACYLVQIVWLSRMYEISPWMEDTSNRSVIEMIASWPLMSMAIRPFLELASFFPIQSHQMFSLDVLPLIPIHAIQLLELYRKKERSQEIHNRIDYLALHVLSDIARWARNQIDIIGSKDYHENIKNMIISRLKLISNLNEFQEQFQFRIHGGYSNKMPDIPYQQSQDNSSEFEEDPINLNSTVLPGVPPLYKDSLALRIRFGGWGLVQMATDPDPPIDEAGCTGTFMLHSADGDRKFDRSLVWRSNNSNDAILRDPQQDLPNIGLKCIDVSLIITDGSVNAGYIPLQTMNPNRITSTSNIEQDLDIQGFLDIIKLNPEEIIGENGAIKIDLLDKNGVKPFLNGQNHLVWKDGEPIDPFIISILVESSSNIKDKRETESLFQREVFNQDVSILEMHPLQRILSSRGPCGFDTVENIPEWAKMQLSEKERELINSLNFPVSYLQYRAHVLAKSLYDKLDSFHNSKEEVEGIVSLAERMLLISLPSATTSNWLTYVLHYGHTISGKIKIDNKNNPIFSSIAKKYNIQIFMNEDDNDRNSSNSRWLIKYTLGIMDSDALSNFIYGELYIPVKLKTNTHQPIKIVKQWIFPYDMKSLISEYACKFEQPFWAPFEIEDGKRILKLPEYTLTEYLEKAEGTESYSYAMKGSEDIEEYECMFSIRDSGSKKDDIKLEWRITFITSNSKATINTFTFIGRTLKKMTFQLDNHFSPSVE
jgi:hypothetical protein